MNLTEDEQELLAANFVSSQLSANNSLFSTGDQSDSLYLLSEGFARLENDSGQNLATLGPGSVLGEVSLFRNSLQEVSATAVSDIEFWRLPDQKLRESILQKPSIGIKLSKNFGAMIAQMQDYLVARLGQTAELADMPQNTLRMLAAQLRSQEVAAGQKLYNNGSVPQGFFLLEDGSLELRPSISSGEATQTVSPGTIVGALALLTNKPYIEDAVARENSIVWALSVDEFQALNTQHRGLRRSLARSVRARLSKSDQEKAASRMAEMPIFSDLPADTMKAITQRMVLQHISAGERVYRIGEGGESLYLIEDGEIELTAENASGVIEELARIGNSGYFGEMSLFTGQIRTEDATATRNTNLWVLFKSDLDELASKHPAISSALSQGLATRLAAEEVEDGKRFRAFSLFSKLSEEELKEVARHLQPTRYRKGEQIFRISTPADSLYLLENGEARVQTFNGGSWLLGPGDALGEKAILTNQPHSGSVTAETDVDLWALSRADLDSLAQEQPTLVANLRRTIEPQHATATMGEQGAVAGAAVGAAGAMAAASRSNTAPAYQQHNAQQQTPSQTPLRSAAAPQPVRTARRTNSEFAPRTAQADPYASPSRTGAPQYADKQYADSKYSAGAAPSQNMQQGNIQQRGSIQQQGMQQQGMQQQAIVPPPAASSGLSRRAGIGINPVSVKQHAGITETRRRIGFAEWFGNLSAFTKLWVALLAILLLYLIGIVVPSTLLKLFFGGGATSQQIVPISASSSLAAVYSRGSYEVMTYDLETGQEIALADKQVAPTATYTPFPTPTPAAIALASDGQTASVAQQSNLRLLQKKSGSTLPRFIKQVEQIILPTAVPPTPIPPTAVPPTPIPTATHTAKQAAYYAAIARGENPNAPPRRVAAAPAARVSAASVSAASVSAASVAPAQQPAPAPVRAAARAWDPRLDQLGVRVEEANVAPGQEYWHLKEVIWHDEKEARGKHHAFVEVLDADGSRIVGHPVKVKWADGEHVGQTEDKNYPDYAFNYQMYAANRAYDITVEGLPSDKLVGAGLGDLENPYHRIHVSYLLTYQKRVK